MIINMANMTYFNINNSYIFIHKASFVFLLYSIICACVILLNTCRK